ncbi:glycerate kinase [bacterium]|nr:MAG: glycerate kinase [bacterium]
MRIVIAPDKFKGSLGAVAVARAVERGWRSVRARDEITLCPMADGGEGTVAAFIDAGFRAVTQRVRGPLGAPVDAVYAFDGATAVIEMAAASGLALLDERARDAARASTFGTGELIASALDGGARRIVVGIGGSATNDGGAGCMQALGARLLDSAGAELEPGGAALARLARIDVSALDARLRAVHVDVACDVDNPLTGPRGAAAVYGPQKGADPAQVAQLDAALAHFARIVQRDLGVDLAGVPGAGAAGGLGYGLMAFLGALPRPGVELVAELRGLERLLDGADLCITGEGRVDEQTLMGKTLSGVARLAHGHGVRAVALAAVVEAEEALWPAPLELAVLPIADRPMEPAESKARVAELLERASARLARLATLFGDR